MLGRGEDVGMFLLSHLLLYSMKLPWVSGLYLCFHSILGSIKVLFQTDSGLKAYLETSSSSIACYSCCSRDLKLIGHKLVRVLIIGC